MPQEAAFARRKRRKAAGGKAKWCFPPGPPSFPYELSALRLRCWAARVAEGFSEFPLSAEETLCKFAATFPLRAVLQPLGAGDMLAVLSFAGCGLRQPKGSLREEPAPQWGVARNGQRFRSEAEAYAGIRRSRMTEGARASCFTRQAAKYSYSANSSFPLLCSPPHIKSSKPIRLSWPAAVADCVHPLRPGAFRTV